MRRLVAAAIAVLGLAPRAAIDAQGVRLTGVTSMQGVDVRPLVEDSVPASEAPGSGPYRQLPDGRVVRCVTGEPYCTYLRSASRELMAPVVQDLRAVAWGLGEGISIQAHVRARGSLGSASLTWPRADDHFDTIEAWVEMDRRPARARVGRQWTSGGLGVYNYDGVSVMLKPGRARVELFGGRSLLAGANEPLTGPGLADLNDLPPDEDGWLLGVSARTPIGTTGNAGAAWQRVIREDRAGLYSERFAADASWRAWGTMADASLTWDINAWQLNDASLRVGRPLGSRFAATLEARQHRPFFEAWTIWGAFSPVAFSEARATVDWRNASGAVSVDARGAYRHYGETEAGLESMPLRREGWRAGLGAEWAPREQWLVHGDYDVDIGFGASRGDLVVGSRWMPDESRWLGLSANGLQHIYEFRVGTGRVIGFRLEAGTRIGADAMLVADAALYSHHMSGDAPSPDWSQRRFSLRLDWSVGRDPGMVATARGRP